MYILVTKSIHIDPLNKIEDTELGKRLIESEIADNILIWGQEWEKRQMGFNLGKEEKQIQIKKGEEQNDNKDVVPPGFVCQLETG